MGLQGAGSPRGENYDALILFAQAHVTAVAVVVFSTAVNGCEDQFSFFVLCIFLAAPNSTWGRMNSLSIFTARSLTRFMLLR